jgi:hypothetical protein
MTHLLKNIDVALQIRLPEQAREKDAPRGDFKMYSPQMRKRNTMGTCHPVGKRIKSTQPVAVLQPADFALIGFGPRTIGYLSRRRRAIDRN